VHFLNRLITSGLNCLSVASKPDTLEKSTSNQMDLNSFHFIFCIKNYMTQALSLALSQIICFT